MLSFKTDKHLVSPCHTCGHTVTPQSLQQCNHMKLKGQQSSWVLIPRQVAVNNLKPSVTQEAFSTDSKTLITAVYYDDSSFGPVQRVRPGFTAPVGAITSKCSWWPFKVYLSIFTLTQIIIKVELSGTDCYPPVTRWRCWLDVLMMTI